MEDYKTTIFVSGHVDITFRQFKEFYEQKLDSYIHCGYNIIVGDSPGTDQLTIKYLTEKKYKKCTVVHLKDKSLIQTNFKKIGGFKYHYQKDAYMTCASDCDLAWVRSERDTKILYGDKYRKRKSGTQKNLERRRRLLN